MPEQPEDRDLLRDEPADAEPPAEDQVDAAAAEAARIGGPPPHADLDPAERPVAEGGGGVAEGFEQAEDDLVRQASHEHAAVAPDEAAFEPETEADRSTGLYGEPDELAPTEVVRDPREDDDDPGAGPGLAAER